MAANAIVPEDTTGLLKQPSDSNYGYHPGIQTVNPAFAQILYRAEYDSFCCVKCCGGRCDLCCLDRSRKYLHVYEFGFERSHPVGQSDGLCCPGSDQVFRGYFDRSIYDQQGCCRKIGCCQGTPVVYANNVQYVCCCQDCSPECVNCMECYWSSLCGDRIRVLPMQYACCCLPTRSCWWHNCCGICGPKDGEPLPGCSCLFENSLKIGTGHRLAQAMESARVAWKSRTGLA